MANYIGWEITNKGRELIARAVNNETKINVTKFKIGAGYNTGNDRELTDLIDKRNEFPINSYERKANGNVEFTFVVSNKTGSGASVIANSYKISEMGIYAQDDSGTEILYAYNKGTDGDYIPVYNGKNAIDIIEKCIIVIDQAATLNVTIDNSMTYLTRESADRRYLEIQALAKIIGIEFGGNIQDTGNKVKGKFYFDNVTKFYYECIENTNLTYNESSKFRAISNKPLSDKLEKLHTMGNNYVELPSGLIIQWGESYFEGLSSNPGATLTKNINFSKTFKQRCLNVQISGNYNYSDESLEAILNSSSLSKNSFTLQVMRQRGGGGDKGGFFWVAIGF